MSEEKNPPTQGEKELAKAIYVQVAANLLSKGETRANFEAHAKNCLSAAKGFSAACSDAAPSKGFLDY
ncbi:hypothetical protein [Lelliottia jeotgali]